MKETIKGKFRCLLRRYAVLTDHWFSAFWNFKSKEEGWYDAGFSSEFLLQRFLALRIHFIITFFQQIPETHDTGNVTYTYGRYFEERPLQKLFMWKSSKCYILWVCVCSLRYTTCNAHAPYWYLWPVLQYFCTLISKWQDFRKRKNYLEQNIYIFLFSLQFCLKHFSF